MFNIAKESVRVKLRAKLYARQKIQALQVGLMLSLADHMIVNNTVSDEQILTELETLTVNMLSSGGSNAAQRGRSGSHTSVRDDPYDLQADFMHNVVTRLPVECLIHGNVHDDDAKRIAGQVNFAFNEQAAAAEGPSRVLEEDIDEPTVVNLRQGTATNAHYTKTTPVYDDNMMMIQWHMPLQSTADDNVEQMMMLILLANQLNVVANEIPVPPLEEVPFKLEALIPQTQHRLQHARCANHSHDKCPAYPSL